MALVSKREYGEKFVKVPTRQTGDMRQRVEKVESPLKDDKIERLQQEPNNL